MMLLKFCRVGILIVVLATSVGLSVPTSSAQVLGPEGTPQIEGSSEGMSYVDASVPQSLSQYWVVFYNLDQFPVNPSPDQTKQSDLRKRILDLRLIMDFNAFAYEPGLFEAYRDALDDAYEQVGEYKDLFDVQAVDKAPIDPTTQAERLAKMNVALAAFRYIGFRDDLKNFFYQKSETPRTLEFKNQPRIWQVSKNVATGSLDSVGNAAMLGQNVLRNLRNEGVLVGDIVDPAQEARFHDVRKAVRSVEVLTDMFPTLTARVSDVREPLDKVVSAFGKTNDNFVALHNAQVYGRDVNARVNELRTSYANTQNLTNDWVNSGKLEAFAARLEAVQREHGR